MWWIHWSSRCKYNTNETTDLVTGGIYELSGCDPSDDDDDDATLEYNDLSIEGQQRIAVATTVEDGRECTHMGRQTRDVVDAWKRPVFWR